MPVSEVYNISNRTYIKTITEGFFNLVCDDPPYFEGPNKRLYYGNEVNKLKIRRRDYQIIQKWKPPTRGYFQSIIKISQNQIIFGCNYFKFQFGPGRIIWDKCNFDSSFSDCEEAYCSLHSSVRLFRFMWNGMMQGKSVTEGHIQQGNKAKNEKKIHPTQKPVALYSWIFSKYAKPGDKVFDPHVGSGSSRIAAWDAGLDYYGCELDAETFNLQEERFKNHIAQQTLFSQTPSIKQPQLITNGILAL